MILRNAVLGDAPFIWQCRAELAGSVALAVADVQDYAAHLAWTDRALADPQRLFLIPENDGLALGYVRFDPVPDAGGWQTSLCVASGARGEGIGAKALKQSCAMAKEHGFMPVFADIHEANTGSAMVFTRCGFVPHGPTPGKPGYSRYWLYFDLKDETHA